MTTLSKEIKIFSSELRQRISEGNRLHDLITVNKTNASRISFTQVDELDRELKSYDSFNKEFLKRSFNGNIVDNEYLAEYSKIIHINDGLISIPLSPNPNYAAAEIIKDQVVLKNMVHFFEDLISKLQLIPVVLPQDGQEIKEEYILLLIASNPDDQEQLNAPLEFREIEERIKLSKDGYKFKIITKMAVRVRDILNAINQNNPDFIHFSGHGENKNLIIQNESGVTQELSKEAIVALVKSCAKPIKLMVFSSCESQAIAKEVSNIIDVSVGMNGDVGDKDAAIFSAQFYSGIAYGLSVKIAFEQGKTAVMMEGYYDFDKPELYCRSDIDLNTYKLIE